MTTTETKGSWVSADKIIVIYLHETKEMKANS